ncbi:MAG: adenosylhomocysteinase [Candidatus Doudnabacteria bacterium]|nr:adenosylhomocysteinase [Candidatus Doudnabacteria bacterium]
MSKVKDMKLAKQGHINIALAEREMPVLRKINEEFKKNKPFKNMTVAMCLHVTKETAVLAKAVAAGGAEVVLCCSNPLSTQDDVAAALVEDGINVFAWKGISNKDYYQCLNKTLDFKPHITIDDGADLISLIHSERKELLKTVLAGQEETTTGVIRLKAMANDGALKYPIVAVNDTPTKHMFDNYYGTGQSTMDGLLRATNVLLSGKIVVVAGYGYCGSGMALRAKGLGARVVVTEVDPLPALKAAMDGFEVMKMIDAAKIGDVFLTATGDKDVITAAHMKLMKDGAIMGNSGHFNVEINLSDLQKLAKSHRPVRDQVEEYTLPNGRRVFLIAEGRLMNLAAAEGHPSAVMDMSFADQALTCLWLSKNYKNMRAQVYDVPKEIDERVSKLKLESLGVKIDTLTPVQKKYLSSWQEGT